MDKRGTSHIARALRGDGSAWLARGFRLHTWRVRPDLCTLENDTRSVQLEPKTMGVLLCLAQHAPEVVTREQFIEEVWNGRIVTDEVLSRAISLLRSELDDNPREPRFVRTIPCVGYALIAPVERLDATSHESMLDATPAGAAPPDAPASAASSPPSRSLTTRRTVLAFCAIAGLATGLGVLWWLAHREATSPQESVRLAVLPLEMLGGTPDDSYLADALTEELTVSLSRIEGLRVVARNSTLRFRSGEADLEEVGRALRATHVVTGSVRAAGRRLRVSVHLAETSSGTELWAKTYERGLTDLFAVQTDIASAVAHLLRQRRPTANIGSGPVSPEAPPTNPDAYRLYLRGRQQLARRGEEGIRTAIALFEDAVAADPGFLRAHEALAWACALLVNVAPAEADTAVARADLALAQLARRTAMSGEFYPARALLEMQRNHWIEADEAFRAALTPSPDDTELRLLYSHMLGAVGARAAAEREAREALANDPLSPAANLRLAVLSLWNDRNGEALRYLTVARDLGLAPSASPELPMLLLTRHRRYEELEETLRQVQRRRRQADDWIEVAVSAIGDPAARADAGAAIEHAAAAGQLDKLLHLGALVLTHHDERALQLLLSRPALGSRELEFLFSQEATGLRRLPAFGQVATRFGLDAYWDRNGWPRECARAGEIIRCR